MPWNSNMWFNSLALVDKIFWNFLKCRGLSRCFPYGWRMYLWTTVLLGITILVFLTWTTLMDELELVQFSVHHQYIYIYIHTHTHTILYIWIFFLKNVTSRFCFVSNLIWNQLNILFSLETSGFIVKHLHILLITHITQRVCNHQLTLAKLCA